MLIEKIIPVGSNLYSVWKGHSSKIGKKIDSQGWVQLFSIWTLTVGGIVLSMDLSDRYIYWEWSGWIEGFIKLLIVSIVFIFILKPNEMWTAGTKRLNIKEFLIHSGIGSILIVFGLFDLGMIVGPYESKIEFLHVLLSLISYVFSFLSCLIVFQFILELEKDKGTWNNFNWEHKFEYLSISVGFMVLAMFLGIFLEDPVASTAAAVSIPFPLIALIWPNHVRHLQRARFYPLFTFAMFLSVRAAWFLVPLALLFFTLRMVNYFRYGIVHPSFGVDFLEEE
ncbi:MAG: hypothetical protein CM15mP52_1530 [Candidatus Neomarinimicrobiota bacterium]|nr:MAG: hypothetical protein CM15mP52_1530 [Candidatus Neomarinimicrobiota bacterium]